MPALRLAQDRPACGRAGIHRDLGFSRLMRVSREVSSASAAAEFLSLACPRERNQREGHPTLSPRFARCPALLAGLGPARTRPSMASNIRAFPPSPAALLGARDGKGEPEATACKLFALDPPSRRSRRRAGGSVRGIAHRRCASFSPVQGRAVEKPRRLDANPRKARAWSPGRVLFGYFLLATQEKVPRPPLRRTKPCEQLASWEESQIKMDASLGWHDEQDMDDHPSAVAERLLLQPE
jgi:hypothetical protein